MHEIVFNAILGSLELAVYLVAVGRAEPVLGALGFAALISTASVGALAMHFIEGGYGGFYSLKLLSWVAFVHLPAVLFASASLASGLWPRLALAGRVAAVVVIGIGVDAFYLEPQRLQRVEMVYEHAAAPRAFRIALVADIQTDQVGELEHRALQMVVDANPDLVLFAGDYIQLTEGPERRRQQALLAEAFRSLEQRLSPAFGFWAVRGDTDQDGWERVFEGTSIRFSSQSCHTELSPGLQLSLLAKGDGHSPELVLPHAGGLHIALGHGPGFALSARCEADLLLAGHTHGGQVQLPFLGPLVTLSKLPRAWAHGSTDLGAGRVLVVSAGLGMERGDAPRLRFLCPPEIVIIDVLPAAS
jgi:predicted MPP superfamily phosphohydrolase